MYVKAKDWPGSERSLAEAHKLFPKRPRYWMIEAQMWLTRKQNAKAIAALEKAYALGKDSMQVVRAYLLGLLTSREYDKALAVANIYKDRPLWSVRIKAVIGRIMVVKKQESKANELFLQAVQSARADELPFVVTQIREAYGSKIAVQRMVAAGRSQPANWYIQMLVGDLCSAAVTDPRSKLTAVDRSQYLKLAIHSYNTALGKVKRSADIAMLSSRLGKVFYDKGDTANSEKAYIQCLKISPNNHAALNNLAYLYVGNLDQPEKALPYVRKVIRLRPQDANVLDTYGWVLGKLKRYDDAKKYLQRSIERNPELAAARYHLGWIFEQTGDKPRALKHYRMGLEMVRTQPYLPLHKLLQGALKRLGA
jgi:tetratricopeptide (TPR) repeat protein